MHRKNRDGLCLALSLGCAIVAWTYSIRILWPWERFGDEQREAMTSTLGDFYSRWAGTRALLVEHKNPYGEEVSRDIQVAFYGHPIGRRYDARDAAPWDEQRFAYPVYVVFVLAPAAWVPFETAQRRMEYVLVVVLGASVVMSLRLLMWRGWLTATAAVFFVLATPQALQGLHLRQLGILVAFLICIAAWCAASDRLPAAGVALAFSTIKPQMAVLPILWLLIWSLGDLKRRWRLLAGFAGSMGALVGAGELILPGWIGDFFRGMVAYRKYVGTPALAQLALGNGLGMFVAILIVVAISWLGWKNRRIEADSDQFVEVSAAFLIAAALAMPLLAPFNQVLLILPALMLAQDWSAVPQALRFVLIAVGSFPWFADAFLLLFPPQVRSTHRQPLIPLALELSVPFLLALAQIVRKPHRAV